MANKETVFKIRGDFNIKNILQGISEIEKALDKVSKPTIETKNLKTNIANLKQTFEDLQKRAVSGFKTPQELSKFERAVEAAGQELKDFQQTANNISIDPKQLAKTDDAFIDLRREITKTKNAIDNINKSKPIKIDFSGFKDNGNLVKQITDARKQMNAVVKSGGSQTELETIRDSFLSNSKSKSASAYNSQLTSMTDEQIQKLQTYNNLVTQRINLENQLNSEASAMAAENAAALQGINAQSTQLNDGYNRLSESISVSRDEMDKMVEREKNVSQLAQRLKYMTSLTSMLFLLRRVLRSIYNDIKELDTAFNEISVVSGKTMDEMWGSFSKVNSIAQEYGVTTKGVVDVQNMYYHQGLSDIQVNKLTTETLTLAKIAGLEYADATNKMTAALNAFNLEADEATRITDVTAALASSAAADSKEIMNALTKTASISASAGTSLENTEVFLTKMINDAVCTRAA